MSIRWFVGRTGAALVVSFGAAGASLAQTDLPACGRYPSNLASHSCTCGPAGTQGNVWGSGPYTGDSDICSAAGHAGVIGPDGGPVMAVKGDGQARYEGSDSNGIRSQDWGRYAFSLTFAPAVAAAAPVAPEPSKQVQAAPLEPATVPTMAGGTCAGIGPDTETRCLCEPNRAAGTVWGSGPYTADSELCTAARHAGAIGLSGGEISVIRLPGLTSYKGTERNGVLTQDWGEYGESFTVNANN